MARRRWVLRLVAAVFTIAGGAGSMALTRGGGIPLAGGPPPLASVTLPPDAAEATSDFRLSAPVRAFHVLVRAGRWTEGVKLTLTGASPYFTGPVRDGMRFQCGRDVPPGAYRVTLTGPVPHGQVTVTVGDREPRVLTGWQILVALGLSGLIITGALTVLTRRAGTRAHRVYAHLCRVLGLAALSLFVYLLLHEGGHALAAMACGCYDPAGSDFWGLHSSPHAGVSSAPSGPWRVIVPLAGPLLPVLAGFVLYALWRSPPGRRWRARSAVHEMYFAGPLSLLFVTGVALAGYATGLMDDGDWPDFAGGVPVSMATARVIVGAIALVSLLMLRVTGRAALAAIRAGAGPLPGPNEKPDRA